MHFAVFHLRFWKPVWHLHSWARTRSGRPLQWTQTPGKTNQTEEATPGEGVLGSEELPGKNEEHQSKGAPFVITCNLNKMKFKEMSTCTNIHVMATTSV